jgi:hypothetical protein
MLGNLITDHDRILVIEEGLLVDELSLREIVQRTDGAAIMTCIGDPPYPQAERLDATSFWAGISIYSGHFVRRIAAEIGEWDLQSTLLRSAAAEAVMRVNLTSPALMSVRCERDSELATASLIRISEPRRVTWPERFLHPTLERLALAALLSRQVSGSAVMLAGILAGLLGVTVMAFGWPFLGLALVIATGPMVSIGQCLTDVRLEPPPPAAIDVLLTWVIEPGLYLALAAYLDDGAAATAWALAITILVFRWASHRQHVFFQRMSARDLTAAAPRLALVGASRETMPWILVPFALLGAWYAGLFALVAYAAATFILVQKRSFEHLLDAHPDQG